MINNPDQKVIESYFSYNEFKNYADLDQDILTKKGIYCIRLKDGCYLPEPFQTIHLSREYKYLYIGKSDSTLKDRLEEEIEHKRPGTFFRNIGALLGYEPIIGHLVGKKNVNNYKFSKQNTDAIIQWLYENVEIFIKEDKCDIEKELIRFYSPLINWTYNNNQCYELKLAREKCRKIARNHFIL